MRIISCIEDPVAIGQILSRVQAKQERNRQQAGDLPPSRVPPPVSLLGKLEFNYSIAGIETARWQVGCCLLVVRNREFNRLFRSAVVENPLNAVRTKKDL